MSKYITTIADRDMSASLDSLEKSMDWVHERLISAKTNRIYHDGTFTNEELQKMAEGKFVDRNCKRYGVCRDCRKVIRLDKPFLGSVHLCG